MTSLRHSVDLPFGNGYATLIGFYEPAEKPSEDCDGYQATFDVEQFIVGGVDIVKELESLKVEYLVSFNRTEQQDYIEWFVEKHIDTIVDVCGGI